MRIQTFLNILRKCDEESGLRHKVSLEREIALTPKLHLEAKELIVCYDSHLRRLDDGRWETYYYERGTCYGRLEFASEGPACDELYNRVSKDIVPYTIADNGNDALHLSNSETLALNELFSDERGDFSFEDKKIAFINPYGSLDKRKYFGIYDNGLYKFGIYDNGLYKRSLYPLEKGNLYIFDAKQTVQSGGYDAAIVYWNVNIFRKEDLIAYIKNQSPELLDNMYAEELNHVFKSARNDFSFVGKKIAFLDLFRNRGRQGFFDKYYGSHICDRYPYGDGDLYIINNDIPDLDAAIVYWRRMLLNPSDVIDLIHLISSSQ